MKNWILFISIWLVTPLSFALNLVEVTSQYAQKIQVIEFRFDSKASAPKAFVVGGDLILDFYNLSGPPPAAQYTFTAGLVRQISLIGVGTRVRTVINGGARYQYELNSSANSIKLRLGDQITQAAVKKANVGMLNLASKSPPVTAGALTISDIKFSRDDNGGGIVTVNYSGERQIGVREERSGERLLLNLDGVSYSPSLLKRMDVTDFATPIKFIDTKATGEQLQIVISTRNQWDYALYQLQGRLVINIRSTEADSQAGLPSLNSSNKGNKVSFNFQNIDVRALLQLLADFSGYNIIVSDSVNGTISLKLHQVPWDQALQIILNSKGLSMKREGNVIRIAPAAEITALNKQQYDNERAQEAVEPIDSATIRLKYAQAVAVQAMLLQRPNTPGAANNNLNQANAGLNTAVGGVSSTPGTAANNPALANRILSARGSILVDKRTNTLIINDTLSRLQEIKSLIEKIDIPVKQVLIEARIVEANNDFEKDLGTRLFLAGVGGNLTYANTLEQGVLIKQTGMNSLSANVAGGTGTTGTTTGSPSFVNQNFGITGGASMATIFAPQ